MKKLFAFVVAAVLCTASFAAESPTPAATPKSGPDAKKACYKQVPVEPDNSFYNDDVAIGAKAGGFAWVRIPCVAASKK